MNTRSHLRFFVLLLGLTAICSCSSSTTEVNGGGTHTNGTCQFSYATLTRNFSDSGQNGNRTIFDNELDSTRSYTYSIQPASRQSMDSLVNAICAAGYDITEAIYSVQYLCDDAFGPHPVFILRNPNSSILSYGAGFKQGSSGRLACDAEQIKYTPR